MKTPSSFDTAIRRLDAVIRANGAPPPVPGPQRRLEAPVPRPPARIPPAAPRRSWRGRAPLLLRWVMDWD